MPNLGPMEILVVLMVALIVLGPKRLPEAARQVGRAVAEVRRWSQTMQAEVRAVLDDDTEAPPPVPWNPPGGTRLTPPPARPDEGEWPDAGTNGEAAAPRSDPGPG